MSEANTLPKASMSEENNEAEKWVRAVTPGSGIYPREAQGKLGHVAGQKRGRELELLELSERLRPLVDSSDYTMKCSEFWAIIHARIRELQNQ